MKVRIHYKEGIQRLLNAAEKRGYTPQDVLNNGIKKLSTIPSVNNKLDLDKEYWKTLSVSSSELARLCETLGMKRNTLLQIALLIGYTTLPSAKYEPNDITNIDIDRVMTVIKQWLNEHPSNDWPLPDNTYEGNLALLEIRVVSALLAEQIPNIDRKTYIRLMDELCVPPYDPRNHKTFVEQFWSYLDKAYLTVPNDLWSALHEQTV